MHVVSCPWTQSRAYLHPAHPTHTRNSPCPPPTDPFAFCEVLTRRNRSGKKIEKVSRVRAWGSPGVRVWGMGQRHGTPRAGCMGLSNLGSTCYMNTGLQCLFHTPLLRDHFVTWVRNRELGTGSGADSASRSTVESEAGQAVDIPISGSTGRVDGKPEIVEEFVRLLRQVWLEDGPETKARRNSRRGTRRRPYLRPMEMKQLLDRVDPRFKGNRELHDSFEYLLDVLIARLHADTRRFPPGAAALKTKNLMLLTSRDKAHRLLNDKSSYHELLRVSRSVWECVIARHGASFFTQRSWGQYIRHTTCSRCGRVVTDFPHFRYLQVTLDGKKRVGVSVASAVEQASEDCKGTKRARARRRPLFAPAWTRTGAPRQADLCSLLRERRFWPTSQRRWSCPGCDADDAKRPAQPTPAGQLEGRTELGVWRLPDLLTIRLCRVVKDNTNAQIKLQTEVQYPIELDLSVMQVPAPAPGRAAAQDEDNQSLRGGTAGTGSEGGASKGGASKGGAMSIHGQATMQGRTTGAAVNNLAGSDREAPSSTRSCPPGLSAAPTLVPTHIRGDTGDGTKRNDLVYDLYCVICHLGRSASRGHFVTHIRSEARSDGREEQGGAAWYTFNDSRVKVKRSLKDTYRSAYALFYARRSALMRGELTWHAGAAGGASQALPARS